MLRSLVGSEMCIRDRYQRRVRDTTPLSMSVHAAAQSGVPTSPRRHLKPHTYTTALPWFQTYTHQTSPDAAENYWKSPREDWSLHRWESFDSYAKAKSLAIRRETADVKKDAARLAELAKAMAEWSGSGAPEARVFIRGYQRDRDEDASVLDSMAHQKALVNQVATALCERLRRLEREQEILIQLPAQIADRQVTEMPSIRVLTPRHHTVWTQNTTVAITWISSGAMEKVRIKVASQFGIWHTVADNVDNTEQFIWTVSGDWEPSKWYHVEITGIHDGRDITTALTPFFTIKPAKNSAVGGCPHPQAGGQAAPSPFKRHSTHQVVYPSLSHSILLERFDPWDEADKCELLMDELHILAVSYTHLRAHETPEHLVCRLLLEKKKKNL
eukprot:TRINITY_DN10189_c0_g1_i9.p1 TRINITY_DN10189_c0_g1~~TRINITY_DN10189_c0_g1_i9.p1  ORF type:complete len:386 (+),score=111.61 TRINITY_DN10189_c0_g1_i9:123-1280(+)